MRLEDSLVGKKVTMANFPHIFVVKDHFFDTRLDDFVVKLALESDAPIGIFPENQVRLATKLETSVGHRIYGETPHE